MRYWVCTLLAVAIFVGSIVAFCSSLGHLLETGTCASGNTPYVIARPCPAGTGTAIALLIGSIFGLFVAMGVFAFRGERPGGGSGLGGSPFVAGWAIFFTATGAFSLIRSLSGDVPVDGKTGGIIVGAIFLMLGVPALVFWIWSAVTGRGDRRAGATASATTSMGFSAPVTSSYTAPVADIARDRIGELERLQRLRDSGALTPAEFEREKARVLGS